MMELRYELVVSTSFRTFTESSERPQVVSLREQQNPNKTTEILGIPGFVCFHVSITYLSIAKKMELSRKKVGNRNQGQ